MRLEEESNSYKENLKKASYTLLCGCIVYIDQLLLNRRGGLEKRWADCGRKSALYMGPVLLSLGAGLSAGFGVASFVSGLAAPFFTAWTTFVLTIGPSTHAIERCVRPPGENETGGYGSFDERPQSLSVHDEEQEDEGRLEVKTENNRDGYALDKYPTLDLTSHTIMLDGEEVSLDKIRKDEDDENNSDASQHSIRL